MYLLRSFSHSLLLPHCFVKYLPDAPGSPAFSGCLYSGWLPASFRCIPDHCYGSGATDCSFILLSSIINSNLYILIYYIMFYIIISQSTFIFYVISFRFNHSVPTFYRNIYISYVQNKKLFLIYCH